MRRIVFSLVAVVALMGMATGAGAFDLKVDANITANGSQTFWDVGSTLVGGDTYTRPVDVWYMAGGGAGVSSVTFSHGTNPAYVTGVTGGTATGSGSANAVLSTITVTAPCAIGTFGSTDESTKAAGSAVQYTITHVNGDPVAGWGGETPDISTAFVNVGGTVTTIGTNCSTQAQGQAAAAVANGLIKSGAVACTGKHGDTISAVAKRFAGVGAGVDPADVEAYLVGLTQCSYPA
jgi:hypothetical protein